MFAILSYGLQTEFLASIVLDDVLRVATIFFCIDHQATIREDAWGHFFSLKSSPFWATASKLSF